MSRFHTASLLGITLAATASIIFICIFTTLDRPAASPPVSPTRFAVIVPHHDVVKDHRLDFWQSILSDNPLFASEIVRVILIGPDHFGPDQTVISYADTSWSLNSGKLANPFTRPSYFTGIYRSNNYLVKDDHAVSSLLSELHSNFPNASLTAFLIGDRVAFSNLQPLQNYISDVCSTDPCLLVASVDFSHYLTLAESNAQDTRTIRLLESKTLEEYSLRQTDKIEADSPGSLYIAQEFARTYNLNWRLVDHTNSAFGDPKTTDTTSHIFAAYLP